MKYPPKPDFKEDEKVYVAMKAEDGRLIQGEVCWVFWWSMYKKWAVAIETMRSSYYNENGIMLGIGKLEGFRFIENTFAEKVFRTEQEAIDKVIEAENKIKERI